MENEESSGDELMQIDMDSKEITQGFLGIAKQISMEDDTDDSSQDPDPERLLRPIRHKRATTSGDSMETDEDDDDDDEDDEDKGHILDGSFTNPLSNIDNMINVGTDYQAVIEPSVEKEEVVEKEELEEEERETKIWESPENIDDEKLTGYIDEATGRFRLPIDRALYILQEEDFKFDVAIFEASNRRELKDVWSPVEISLFQTCFLHFGKRFKKIQAAMPTRSLGQIIQYYYDTKKTRNYKMTINCHLNETDTYDELFKEIDEFERVPAGYCENCNMKSQVLIMNSIMKRHECKPCILYFRLMRIPRPASLRQKVARHHRVACPEYMKNYVADYVDMISPGDGNAIKRLGIGKVKEPEDEDCVVVDESPLRRPSAPYIVETGEFDDPVDSNTCRNTRVFLGEGNRSMIENIRKKHHLAVPLVWRQKQNKAMEDVEVLNEAARRKMYDATVTLNRVKNADVKQWAADMEAMKFRMQRAANEDDGPGGTRSGKVRMDQNWTPEEKKDVVRCFHWYFDNFELISEIMLTKTPEQVRNFYMDNEKLLVQSIDAYRTEIRERLSQIRRDA